MNAWMPEATTASGTPTPNVAQQLLILAGGIGGAAVLQAALRRRGPSRRSFALGAHIMHG